MAYQPSTLAFVHAAAPPVGLVDVSTLPWSSTATQSADDGHAMPSKPRSLIRVIVQAAASPPGAVEVITSPAASMATHNDVEGHETS